MKPAYLVKLQSLDGFEYFISLDKPEQSDGFIQVKGFYCDWKEEKVFSDYKTFLSSQSQDGRLEIMFPTHRVNLIRNLSFVGQKPTTQPQ